MRKYRFLLMCMFLVVLLTACQQKEPEIELDVTVSTVSEEEYKSVGATKDLVEPVREDFKLYSFHFHMEHGSSVKDRNVEMYEFGNLKGAINAIDGSSRYWYGGWSEQDNEIEDFATYDQQFVFYAKGLTDEDIKEAFRDETVTVSWMDNNEEVKKVYNLAELIEFH